MLSIGKLEAYLKPFSSIITLAALFALTACGGGGGGTGSSNNTGNTGGGTQLPSVKLNDRAQIIEYHGDSTVFGWVPFSGGDQVARPAPVEFESRVAAHHTVRNMGRSGTAACDLLNGVNGYEQDGEPYVWASRMEDSDATVVIINHALNDVRRSYGRSGYSNCLNQLVDIAITEGKVVILETPNPAYDGQEAQTLAEYVATMRSIATQKGVNLIDQFDYLQQPQWNDTVITPDGLHPSQEIYIEKGRFAAERFRMFDVPATR